MRIIVVKLHSTSELSLADLLRVSRLSKGLTLSRLGRKLDRSASAISCWELGTRRPRADVVPDLSAELGIERDVLARMVAGV